jgi:hypothetical protein
MYGGDMEEVSNFSSVLSSFFHPYFPISLHSSICLQTSPSSFHLPALLFPSVFPSISPSLRAHFSSSVMTRTTVHSGPAFQRVRGVLVERQ